MALADLGEGEKQAIGLASSLGKDVLLLIDDRAEILVSTGLGVADAAHLVFAEAVESDFITCDDRLCKKCRALDLAIWTGNPVAFCDKEGLR